MYDTARRVKVVKHRVRENSRRRQQSGIYGLSAACILLFAALIQTAGMLFIGHGQTAAQNSFGAMLLQEDAGGYVLVGVAAFVAAVVLTVICMRLHEREKQKREREHKEDTA